MTAGDLEFSTLSAVIDRRYSSFRQAKTIFRQPAKARSFGFLSVSRGLQPPEF
jgi:hypothetical protein